VALVVHGSGLDEVALHGPTSGVLVQDGELRHITITPADAGVRPAELAALSGGGPAENAEWLLALLAGKGSDAHSDAVALNAGTLAWATGNAPNLREAVRLARAALAGGGGLRRLERLRELSHGA
jgi:anthranilate phosphoribosyltransferase